jgi:hypothetical protein
MKLNFNIKTFCNYYFLDRTGLKFSEDYSNMPLSSTGMGVPVPPHQNNNFDSGIFLIFVRLVISHGLPLS